MNIIECSIKDLQDAFSKQQLTSQELVLFYLERIASIDQGPIKYNSVLEVNPDALFQAQIKDSERKNGTARGMMHGIPVLIKDNINTSGAMHTTAGSLALRDNFAEKDAFIVKRLKEEGAIILGKTNLTEFANFITVNMLNGYSSLGGKVLCPYNIDKDPSGSSSGSAVSVSINLAPVAIGTETGGSIMSPSMQNGVVGLKPTIGLVSRNGIVPISSTLDTAGPIAKNVYDVATLLSAIRGNDEFDSITMEKPIIPIDYRKAIKNVNPSTLRIGIDMTNFNHLSNKRQEAFYQTIDLLSRAGVTIVKPIETQPSTKIFYIMIYEFKRVINAYLSSLGTRSKMRTLEDIIHFNMQHEQEALKYGQILFEEAQYKTSGRLNETKYIDSLKERDKLTKIVKEQFKTHNLDAIYFSNYTSLGPHCGFPTITVPIGVDEEHIPIGTYILGDHYQEAKILQVASIIEKTMNGRRNPLEN